MTSTDESRSAAPTGRPGAPGDELQVDLCRRIIERLPVAISVVDLHGRQVASNPAYRELFGFGAEVPREHDVGAITRSEDHRWTRSYLMRLASGELDEFVTDKAYVRADGTTFVARLTSRPLRFDGVCDYLMATIVPIEEREGRSVAPIARLLEFTSDTLTLVDADGRVIETTGRYAGVLGYPSEFWETRSVLDLLEPEDAETVLELRRQLLATPGGEIEAEMEVRAADGTPQLLQVRAYNGLDDPDLRGIMMVSRNVTEQRRIVSELAAGRSQAEAVADARTRLLATVSHELRNPLHAVRGLAELLVADAGLPADAAEIARSLHRQVTHLTQVTQDLLDAARLDAGSVQIETVPVRLSDVVADVVTLGRVAAPDGGVEVSARTADDVPEWIDADPTRLRQVLSNLIGNAVKFTDSGSVELIVRTETSPGGSIVPGARLVMTVVDTGVGIPPPELETVLQPFRTASTGGPGRGAGLGLSIVQRLVDAMGGTMTMRSRVGVGTEVDVEIPLRASAPAVTVDEQAPSAAGAHRVLVVEDNPVNQQLAVTQLARLGMVSVIAGTAEEAWALLTDPGEAFTVVLMDEQLPGMSGSDAVRRMRAAGGRLAELPVVGLTASASTDSQDAFLAAGMDAFLAKPASMRDLASAIAQVTSTGYVRPVVAASSDATGPAVDAAVLDRLVADLGDAAVVHRLIETYLAELPARTDRIVDHLETDAIEAGRAAHTLKSSSRLLGAIELGDLCERIERGADAERNPVAGRSSHSADVLRGLVGRTAGELTAWCGGGGERR